MRVEVKSSVILFVAIMALSSAGRFGLGASVLAALLITASVFLHEVAHASAATFFYVKVKRIGIGIKGGYTVRENSRRPVPEFIITAAGPMLNLLLFEYCASFQTPFASWIGLANLVLGLTNLIPFGPTDGARFVKLLSQCGRRETTH